MIYILRYSLLVGIWYPGKICFLLNIYSSIVEPSTFKEETVDLKWIEAMKLEIDELEENNTWSIVDLPKGKVPITCK